jgi:predicted ArsR family transcriptional regulator
MPIPTRTRILDYLSKEQAASVRELAHVLTLTGADIRHHLAVLIAADMVTVLGRRKESRGRPVNVYGLSPRMSGNNLDRLADAILLEWLGNQKSEELRADSLQSLAGRLAGRQGARESLPLPRRLTDLVVHLNLLHYHSRWEATASGPRIVLAHCPYAAILAEHPELCQMDRFLLEARLEESIEQTARLQVNVRGLPYCEFLIQTR